MRGGPIKGLYEKAEGFSAAYFIVVAIPTGSLTIGTYRRDLHRVVVCSRGRGRPVLSASFSLQLFFIQHGHILNRSSYMYAYFRDLHRVDYSNRLI